MGKLLILSVTNGEQQILDRIKDFLAEEPGIEIVEPPATKHTLTFPGLELHLRKQTVKWRGQPLHLTHLEFFTLAYLARQDALSVDVDALTDNTFTMQNAMLQSLTGCTDTALVSVEPTFSVTDKGTVQVDFTAPLTGPAYMAIPGTEEHIPCDTLLLSVGLIPENELSKAVGVELSPVTNGPTVNESLETSIPGVFACGNVLHVHDLVDFVSQEAEALANGVAAYLKEGTLTECGLTVETCPVIGHVIPQKVSGTQDFSLSFRVRRPMGKCRIEVRQGDTVLTTVKLPKAIPAEMIQFTVPCKEMTADRNVEVFVDEV